MDIEQEQGLLGELIDNGLPLDAYGGYHGGNVETHQNDQNTSEMEKMTKEYYPFKQHRSTMIRTEIEDDIEEHTQVIQKLVDLCIEVEKWGDNIQETHYIPVELTQNNISQTPEVSSSHTSRRQPKKKPNVLINIGTQMFNHFHVQCKSEEDKALFKEKFGPKNEYKNRKRYIALFKSTLQPYCLQFLEKHAMRLIILSESENKAEVIKHLGMLRQGAINRRLDRVACQLPK